jgi:DNA-binding MarR family transcriptional regulator
MPPADTAHLASDLRIVIGHLLRRLRAQRRQGIPIGQAAVLGRLERDGAAGTSDLAGAERVRPQSMAQTVAELERAGLVARSPDPTDGRRQLVALTDEGRTRILADRADRESWLAGVLDAELTPAERATLAAAVPLLRRIADAGPRA